MARVLPGEMHFYQHKRLLLLTAKCRWCSRNMSADVLRQLPALYLAYTALRWGSCFLCALPRCTVLCRDSCNHLDGVYVRSACNGWRMIVVLGRGW